MSGNSRRALFAQFGGAILKSIFIKPDCRLAMVYRQPPDVRVTLQLCQVEPPVTGVQSNLYDLLLLELCDIFPAVAKLEKDLFSVLIELRCR